VVGFSLSTVYTPAVSLSLEGKNLATLKTLPIPALTIFKAKVFKSRSVDVRWAILQEI
jgi:hypothetical protein